MSSGLKIRATFLSSFGIFMCIHITFRYHKFGCIAMSWLSESLSQFTAKENVVPVESVASRCRLIRYFSIIASFSAASSKKKYKLFMTPCMDLVKCSAYFSPLIEFKSSLACKARSKIISRGYFNYAIQLSSIPEATSSILFYSIIFSYSSG